MSVRLQRGWQPSIMLTFDVMRFSAARTTPSLARTPRAAPALEMASMAYSTWYRRPSGLKVVVRVSYRRLIAATRYLKLPALCRTWQRAGEGARSDCRNVCRQLVEVQVRQAPTNSMRRKVRSHPTGCLQLVLTAFS